ncbi:hypothetical protein Ga0100231_004925 [Opitutaceae bacterium TAV4]|nr:hypothetical protein Ga0100231_004925 [Opitutaceae bacterium TAV4]RRK02837.1 hypothetical protein Ga0100230_004070 [Opitutaceae bacterium TAV3]
MMKKLMLITALVFAGSLFAAAPVAAPTAQAVALNQAADAVAKSYDAQIAAAKVAQNKEAVATLAAQRKAAILAHNLAHKAEVAALITEHIDEIASNNPGAATSLIKRHLTIKNTGADGVVAAVFAQDDSDRALAAKLLEISNGSQSYYYYQYYATAEELRALPGSNSANIASAVARRAKQLGITSEIFPAYYEKSIGLGLVTKGYDTWFNQLVRTTWRTNRAAALKLLEEEQAGIGTLINKGTDAQKRIDNLRELAARFDEIIKRGG